MLHGYCVALVGELSSACWRLVQVPGAAVPFSTADPVLGAWDDLEDRERRLGIGGGNWFLLSPGERPDPDILEFFRASAFLRKAPSTQASYANDLKVHFDFLARKGRSWRDATAEDFADYEFWRRRDPSNPRIVSGSKLNREIAACRLFYEWQANRGVIPASPVVLDEVRRPDGTDALVPHLRSRDVRSSRVNWMTPAAYRRWRDVGLGGYVADGTLQPNWRGRNDGRNMAFAELLWSSGLRLQEAGTLLTIEVPDIRQGRRYLRGRLANRVAKGGSGRDYWVSSSALGMIDAYVVSTRQAAIDRARDAGRYDELGDIKVVTRVRPGRKLAFRNERGHQGVVSMDELGVADRRRLFIEDDDGLAPLALWLTEAGLPMPHQTWEAVFAQANQRCERLGVGADAGPLLCRPHMLRHSFALRMLVTLQHLFDRRLGLTPEERKEYRHLFGDPWVMVKELLGHRNLDTTRDTYLIPATGLQIDLLLNGENDDAAEVTGLLSRLAEESPRMIDLPSDGAGTAR